MLISEGWVNMVPGENVGTTGGAVGNMVWNKGDLRDSVSADWSCLLYAGVQFLATLVVAWAKEQTKEKDYNSKEHGRYALLFQILRVEVEEKEHRLWYWNMRKVIKEHCEYINFTTTVQELLLKNKMMKSMITKMTKVISSCDIQMGEFLNLWCLCLCDLWVLSL